MTMPHPAPDNIDDAVAGASDRASRYRWMICGLLFAATAINYVDRQMIGVLKPTLAAGNRMLAIGTPVVSGSTLPSGCSV